MDKTEIGSKINEIICDTLGVTADKVVPEAKLIEDLEADSLDQKQLVMALEDEFNIDITDEDAEKIETVAQAVDCVSKKI